MNFRFFSSFAGKIPKHNIFTNNPTRVFSSATLPKNSYDFKMINS